MKAYRLISACLFMSSMLIIFPLCERVTAKSTDFSFPATPPRNTISGYIFDPQRRAVTQIFVELQNEVNSVIGRTRTDGSGRYVFTNLSAGRFSVRVLPFGTNLEEQTQEVEIVNYVAPGSNTSAYEQKDFYLHVKKTGGDSPSLTGTIFVQEIPVEAQKVYERAISSLDAKKTDAGIDELKDALKLFPDYLLALEALGNELIKRQQFASADEIYKHAVMVNARSFNGWYGLSYANYALNQSEKAVEAAKKAISINSKSVEALLMLGISQRQAKDYDNAEKSLKTANKISKNKSPDVHWNLALLYAHNFKRYGQAADELEWYLKTQQNVEKEEAVKKLIKQFRERKSG